MNTTFSIKLFEKAKQIIPGGVNSPVRACQSVGSIPLFIKSGKGSKIYDIDGNEYIDYVGSWGPLILGHAHSEVIEAVTQVLVNGNSFGAPTELEIQLAQLIIDAVPSIEMVRMVNSGTEATMSAIRLARGFTGRDYVIKFDGCYHGHSDALLVKAGSGVVTLGIPGSPGVPSDFAKYTLSLPYNDLEQVKDTLTRMGDQVACIIVEPVAGNMGLVLPEPGFLEGLRELTHKYGVLLIFDEVMTGFRVAYGGAQEVYNITPDLTCLGKIVGGGMPVGAFGGNKKIMAHIAPTGSVYQAGTLSGNPIAMSAGIKCLEILKNNNIYPMLELKASQLENGLRQAAKNANLPVELSHIGSMLGLFFINQPVKNFEQAKQCNLNHFTYFYKGMREQGIYIAPSQFEAMFISTEHSENDIQQTIQSANTVFNQMSESF